MAEPAEIKNDFKVSWQMLKTNYKAFLATELFAFITALILFLMFSGIVVLIYFLAPALSLEDLQTQIAISRLQSRFQFSNIGMIFYALVHVLLVGLLYCQYGLSYDIMSTGDLFSEFKRAFWYFKRYWWQYLLLSLISGFGLFIPVRRQVINLPYTIGDILFTTSMSLVRFLLLFLFIILSSIILPSLTAQGSLKNSFTEASRIMKKYPKRLFKTWIRFFLIFFLPMLVLILTNVLFLYFYESRWLILFYVIYFAFYLVFLFIGIPLSTLMATRIYNNVDIEKFKPQTEDFAGIETEKLEEKENSEK